MTPSERERYSRQTLFEGIGEEGQERLLRSHAAVVGCGALGSFHAATLARAGVGKLTLIDRDYVEWSNLQRQWLYEESDASAALPKAAAAARHIQRINSGCAAEPVIADLTADNVDDILENVNVVLDGCDNFETRYLINDWCVRGGIPWIYGAAVGSYGLTMPVTPGNSACLACVYPEAPGGAQPTCETAGVLSSITSMIAAQQAADAIRILTGSLDGLRKRITTIDVWSGTIRQVDQPPRDPQCRACGRADYIYLDSSRRVPVSLCGRNAVQIHERRRPVAIAELAERLRPLGQVRVNEFALRFFTPPYEMTIFPDGRAIIKGTTETGVARSLYARYIGN